MTYWIEWNGFISGLQYHIEDVGASEWIEWLGLEVDPGNLELLKNINTTGPRLENEHTWDTLPQGKLLERLRKAARRYGYL